MQQLKMSYMYVTVCVHVHYMYVSACVCSVVYMYMHSDNGTLYIATLQSVCILRVCVCVDNFDQVCVFRLVYASHQRLSCLGDFCVVINHLSPLTLIIPLPACLCT